MTSPYPNHLVKNVLLKDGTEIVIRPIRSGDAHIEQNFVKHLSEESRYFRFMHSITELTPSMLKRFTQIDYDQEMAFIAVTTEGCEEVEIGVSRYFMEADEATCEFAVVVADEWQGQGIATALMRTLMEVAKSRGLSEMHGEVLSNNRHMLNLMKRLGFRVKNHPEDSSLRLVSRNL